MTTQRCYTIKEAADRLSISQDTVRRLIASRKLPAFRLDVVGGRGCIRINEADLDALMKPVR